jgi:hypothetical protein
LIVTFFTSECDSPLRLVDLTFDYLDKNWADEIDFVICELSLFKGLLLHITWEGTGDNARCVPDPYLVNQPPDKPG